MEFVSYDIESKDFRRAGAASRAIKEHLKHIGADADAIRRTMIAAYEAEMNVVIHSVGGRLEASLSDSRIDVNVVDEGPGIPDVELAMTEGYSTASAEARALGFGAGMGLPNIKRSSDRMRVTSRVGEGTRVSFTVNLRPEITCAAPAVSLYASADRCRDCRACITACPTQALRVRNGRPMVLEHLCIECAECIEACKSGALTIRDVLPSLDDVKARMDVALVVPPALLAGFGPDYPPARVLAAASRLGFVGARTAGPFEEAVREAALGLDAGGPAGGQTSQAPETGAPSADDGAAASPLILPMCPAIVNLVELKFPSLVGALAPMASPWEMVETASAGERLACVVSCPGQRSVLSVGETAPGDADGGASIECLLPEALRGPLMKELTGPAATTRITPDEERQAPDAASVLPEVLVVSGIRHVMAVLEQIENGLLEDMTAIEAYACEGGCFGSPLLFEDHHVARRRWARGKVAAKAADSVGTREELAVAAAAAAAGIAPTRARRRPYATRPGVRLDPDMGKAVQKLGRLQTLTRSLPGRDCGACGAPTCAALAEDVVMERASIELCPYIAVDKEDAES
jgi:anti-sigma regulatory factor (Ser/Thr protein kinase)/Na+-translocating ferredoxin:NAD+ oxidoreductase RNF subunit RnfB